ncbi:hypothetical protein [Streptomyces sp. SYP-A7193]|uniref:hypothetical protein n=1 Tax=Streptomyces sp. SYP-A7193 TaxID=2662065 RepID=UPI0012919556|nr:hypothetical protein [Streptomyces sp. SYP-A7193]QFX79511.1 hypothetical protein GEV49_00145 [Streptomyces sp. SYP-A7193]
MEPADLLTRHAIAPERLDHAPAPPALVQALTRVQEVPSRPCAVCGAPVATARAVVFPEAGPRWVDLCWDHGMAVRRRHRLPQTLEGIAADLRDAAREAGLPAAEHVAFYSSFEAAAASRPDEEP